MEKDFLGIGLSFPLSVKDGKIAWSRYEDSIKESIMLILNTAKGERIMRPDFGSGLHELVYSINNTTTASIAIFHVEEALKKWEPRIELIKVDVNADAKDGDRLIISIEYRIISTNTRHNLVYPFYIGRG